MGLGSFFTGALKLIPGVGNVVSAVEGIATLAGAVGGESGKKIESGVKQITEGLKQADARGKLTPEQEVEIVRASNDFNLAMAKLDLKDVEGGRRLAKAEIDSEDEYVRRTRPMLLRWYGKGSFLLVFSCVLVAFISAFSSAVTKDEAEFIISVLKWALPTISATFLMMYRAYVGGRTKEKLTKETGVAPESLLDKAMNFAARR
jgi:hypothetical protein